MKDHGQGGGRSPGLRDDEQAVAAGKSSRVVQRYAKPGAGGRSTPTSRRYAGVVQRKEAAPAPEGTPAPEAADSGSASARQLPPEVQGKMESALGADFSGVQFFEGSMAESYGAEALAQDDEVHFAPGRFRPEDDDGQELIGHELAHVVQQRSGRVAGTQGKDAAVVDDPALEAEADRAGARAARGESAELPAASGSPGAAIQRRTTVNPVAADYKSAAEIQGMTIAGFLGYTSRQADWSVQLAEPDKTRLRQLHLDLVARPHLATGGGALEVRDFLAVPDPVAFELYCRACHAPAAVPTSRLEPVDDMVAALELGWALERLNVAVGGDRLHVIGNDKWIKELVSTGRVEDFAQYVEHCDPIIQAQPTEEQGEIASFLKHPQGLWRVHSAMVRHVRNLHRFEVDALNTLMVNWLDFSKSRPLTLIIHTPLDHNAAFHHDPALTATIQHPTNLTLMIEGARSLADAQGLIEPIARAYGQNDRIDQVMLAGHGESRILDIAGDVSMTTDADGVPVVAEHSDDLDLDRNQAATEAFFRELLANMDPAGRQRILLNGCLTASNDIQFDTSAGADPAEQQIQDQLRDRPSLATWLADFAVREGLAGAQVMGANASFGRGVEFIDPATGDLSMSDPGYDPALTAPKLTYIREGHEPLGVIRAVVEEWQDPAGAVATPPWLQEVTTRLAARQNDWDNVIIQTAFDAIVASYQSAPATIRRLGDDCSALSHLYFRNEASVSLLAGLMPAHQVAFFRALEGCAHWPGEEEFAGLAVFQRWQALDAAKRPDLLALISGQNTSRASEILDFGFLGDAAVRAMAPVADAGAPSDGQLVLALSCILSSTPHPGARAFVRALAAGGNRFPPAIEARIESVLTSSSVSHVLVLVGLADVSRGGATVDANVDQDADGTNETYVDATARQAAIGNCHKLNVRSQPRMGNNILGTLDAGDSVYVFGTSGNWCAIEYNGATGFVYSRYVV